MCFFLVKCEKNVKKSVQNKFLGTKNTHFSHLFDIQNEEMCVFLMKIHIFKHFEHIFF